MSNPGPTLSRAQMMTQNPGCIHPSRLSTSHVLPSFDLIPNADAARVPPPKSPSSLPGLNQLEPALELELELIPQKWKVRAGIFPKQRWGTILPRKLKGMR